MSFDVKPVRNQCILTICVRYVRKYVGEIGIAISWATYLNVYWQRVEVFLYHKQYRFLKMMDTRRG